MVVPAAETSNNTVWFIKVVSTEFSGDNRVNDDCGNIILPHTAYFTGNFLERVFYSKSYLIGCSTVFIL